MLPTLPSQTVYAPPRGGEATGAMSAAPVAALPPIAAPRAKRILDFDIENRPLSYWYDGACTAEVTAVAWAFFDDRDACCMALGENQFYGDKTTQVAMLKAFVEAYNEADMVTGHYIRRHDLPILNGAMVEHGLSILRPKLVSDTRTDLVSWKDLQKSQEALGAWLHLDSPKEKMTPADWREANRLTPRGIEETRRRVVGDVRQHMELREALLERGLLKPPKMWRP